MIKHTVSILTSLVLFLFLTNTPAQMKKGKMQDMNHSQMIKYEAILHGKDVVPPVNTKAYGEATFEFSRDGKKLWYKLTLHNIAGVMMAHIHHAPIGKDGPIAFWLYKGKETGKINGILSKGTITDKDVNLDSLRTWMNNSDAYVLVHTKEYPNGEIRGTIKQTK